MKNVANATNYLDVDTKELFRIYSKDKDNKDVRNILIERHLYLVNLLAKKYINKGVEYEDLYQVGSLALIYAIDMIWYRKRVWIFKFCNTNNNRWNKEIL